MALVKKEFNPHKIGTDMWKHISDYLEYWDKVWLRGMCDMKLQNPYITLEKFASANLHPTCLAERLLSSDLYEKWLTQIQNTVIRLDLLSNNDLINQMVGIPCRKFPGNRILWKCDRCQQCKLVTPMEGYGGCGYYINVVGIRIILPTISRNFECGELTDIFEYVSLCDCFIKDILPKATIKKEFCALDKIRHENPFVFPFPRIRWNKEIQMYEAVSNPRGYGKSRRIVVSNGDPIICR